LNAAVSAFIAFETIEKRRMKIMRFRNLPGIARHVAFLLVLAIVAVLSVDAQNSNTGSSSMSNSNTGSSSSQTANSNTGRANTAAPANTPRVEATNTPRTEASTTPRTQVQTVVEKESSFPWGLLGLLGLAGLIPKKRSVEVTGVRETARETRTTTDNRDDKSNH
jgi:hypothetical protein